jgi:hypothetical protein
MDKKLVNREQVDTVIYNLHNNLYDKTMIDELVDINGNNSNTTKNYLIRTLLKDDSIPNRETVINDILDSSEVVKLNLNSRHHEVLRLVMNGGISNDLCKRLFNSLSEKQLKSDENYLLRSVINKGSINAVRIFELIVDKNYLSKNEFNNLFDVSKVLNENSFHKIYNPLLFHILDNYKDKIYINAFDLLYKSAKNFNIDLVKKILNDNPNINVSFKNNLLLNDLILSDNNIFDIIKLIIDHKSFVNENLQGINKQLIIAIKSGCNFHTDIFNIIDISKLKYMDYSDILRSSIDLDILKSLLNLSSLNINQLYAGFIEYVTFSNLNYDLLGVLYSIPPFLDRYLEDDNNALDSNNIILINKVIKESMDLAKAAISNGDKSAEAYNTILKYKQFENIIEKYDLYDILDQDLASIYTNSKTNRSLNK